MCSICEQKLKIALAIYTVLILSGIILLFNKKFIIGLLLLLSPFLYILFINRYYYLRLFKNKFN